MYKKVVSLVALFLIIGCGNNSNTQENLSQKSGKVADGYLNGATVCIDINNNLKCDSDEPSTTTDKKGNYHLKFNKDISDNNSILAYGGVNTATGLSYTGLLKAPVEYNNINPISTLVSYNKENFSSLKKAEEAVSNLFGLDRASLTKDPIKQAKIDKKLFKTALKIEKLTNIALSLDTDKKRDRKKIDRLLKRVAKISAKTEDFIGAIVESSKEEFNLDTSTDKLKNNLSLVSNIIDGKIEVNDDTNEAEQDIELATKIVIKSIENNQTVDNQTIEENIEECKKNGIDSCLQEENNQSLNTNRNGLNENNNTRRNQNQNLENNSTTQQNRNNNNSNENNNTRRNQNQNLDTNNTTTQQNRNNNNSNHNTQQNQNQSSENNTTAQQNRNNNNSNHNTQQNQNQNQSSENNTTAQQNRNNTNSNHNTQQNQNQNQSSENNTTAQQNRNNSNSNHNTQQNQNQSSENNTTTQQNRNNNNSNHNTQQNQSSENNTTSNQTQNDNNTTTNPDTNQTQNDNNTTTNPDTNQTQNDNNTTTNPDTNQTQNDNNTTTNLDTNSTPPVITLNGDNNISIILGNSYKELGAKAIDDIDGEVNVTIESNVDETNLGEYKVIYKAVDSDNNEANKTRIVNIINPKVIVSNLDITGEKCGHFEKMRVVNKDEKSFYTLNDNDWGRHYLDENSTGIQCVFKYDDENGTEKGGWYWGWPYNHDYQVKSYPEAMYGVKFRNTYNPNSGFPAVVSTIDSVNVDIAYRDLNLTRNYNIALEFWLHTSEDTSMNNIQYEIMFRFDPKGFHPNRTKIGEVTLDGTKYTVYTNNHYQEGHKAFINFVAQEKVNKFSIDFKKALDYLTELEFKDMPKRYMSGIEMGVEVIDGSGAIILDKFDVDLRFNEKEIQERKIEENFDIWSIEYDEDKTPLDKKVDANKTGWKWRNSNNRLVFRKKNTAIIQLYSNSKENYLYTMFDKSFALNNAFSAFTLSGSISNDYNYKVMLKDSDKWCVSDNILDDYLNLHKSQWYEIEQSDDLVNSFENDEDLPKLTFSDSCDNFDFKNIKGLGVYYALKDDKQTGYFQLKRVSAHQVLPQYAVFEKFIKEDNVSNLLFGLCTTPNRKVSQNETFIDNYKEWVSYIRWPGGSMIEGYNLKDKSELTYSVGKWTEFMKDKISSLEFLIGVSSKRAYNGDWNATEYGYGLVNYLNKDYNQSWGDEALDKPTNLKFVEIGNEPDLEGLSADKYGPVLVDYEKGIHKADSNVKIVAPTTTHGAIGNMLPKVLKEYGDSIDIVSAHNYTDNPKDYKDDLILIKSYINDFMSDNERRKKDEIKMAYTEYNSLAHTTRKGVIHEESWAKVIWHSETFSYFIQEGLYMASIWHAFFQGGHGVYQFDGTPPYPIVSGIKFWKNHIDFSKHPKVLYSSYGDKDITITPIEMDDKLVVFVVNSSPESDKELNITFGSNEFFKDEVTITTLTHTPLSEYYDAKDLADNVSSNEAIMKKLKYLNPDAKIYIDEDDDNKTKIQFPKLDITQKSDSATLDNGILTYTFPKYTISILELEKK